MAKNLGAALGIQRKNKAKKKMAGGGDIDSTVDSARRERQFQMNDKEKQHLIVPMTESEGMKRNKDYKEKYESEEKPNFSKGGGVECMHCGGMNYAHGGEVTSGEEEGPGTDESFNIDAKDYDQEPDSEIHGQPKDSNEHSDDLTDEDKHDMVEMIRRKLKLKREE